MMHTAAVNQPCLDAALEYLELGFSVMPVARDKKPLIPWKEFQTRQATQDEVYAWWEKHPQANVGIITGSVSGIWVLDADGPTGIEWMKNHAPRTSVYSQTAKGVQAFFRLAQDQNVQNKVRLALEVDIRGEGGYVVAPPSIHATGHVYRWVFPEGLDGWNDLSIWYSTGTKSQNKNLGIDLSTTKSPVDSEPAEMGSRNNKLAQIVGYWITLGHTYRDIVALAKNWNSECRPPLGELEFMRTVKSIWDRHCKSHPGHTPAPVPDVAESTESDFISEPTPEAIPDDILQPGGLLQDLMDYIEASTAASFPIFALGASICAIGTLIGQKVITESGLRTNMYVIALADSGTGKDAPLSAINQVFTWAGAQNYLGPNHLASGTAILKRLVNFPRQLCLLDEIGDIVKGLKNPNSPSADIPRHLKSLFSSTDRSETKSYANSQNNITLGWHHLSIYAVGVPERFWESLTFGDVTDGFLARTLILESDHEPPRPKIPTTLQPSQELVQSIKWLADWEMPITSNVERKPVPRIVEKDEQAQEFFQTWADRWFLFRNAHRKEDDGTPAIYGRAAEHAHKLALIHAASRLSTDVATGEFVRLQDVQWACALVDWVVPRMVQKIKGGIAVNLVDQWRRKILKAIDHAGKIYNKPGGTMRDILRYVRGITKKEAEIILQTMLAAEEIVQKMPPADPKAGRPSIIFVRTK